jgi:heme/copper-type cytochrome/quinol oxidase subunit 2
MRALDWIAWGCFWTALVALPFLVFNWILYIARRARARRRGVAIAPQFPIKSILFFALPILTVFCVAFISKSIAKDEIRRTIDSLTDDAHVLINRHPAQNSKEVISTLKTLHWIYPHHSHPTKRIDVQISDESRCLVLRLGRDSDDPREYWVFYPKHYITSGNELGRVITPIFDND